MQHILEGDNLYKAHFSIGLLLATLIFAAFDKITKCSSILLPVPLKAALFGQLAYCKDNEKNGLCGR